MASVALSVFCLLCATVAFAQTRVEFFDTGEEFAGPFPSWRNIKTDYGAKGDGQADDTDAIQKALDELKGVVTNDWSVLYFPAGTYRITRTLKTLRQAHSDYLGSNLIGEDPETTILLWDGPASVEKQPQFMLRYDSWYCKVSRLTFDGRGKANGGLVRAGGFATYCEHSDLIFKDIPGIALNLGNGEAYGIAETAVLRCKFIRCAEGVATINYNTLDIYVWWCLFEDCGKGIFNYAGGYQAYENVFLRSKEFDVGSINNMYFSFVNNTSIGSKTFLKGIGQYVRGNRIYNTTDPLAINVTSDLILIDNLVSSRPGTTGAVVNCGSSTLSVGNTFNVAGWPIHPVHPLPGAAMLRQDLEKAMDGDPSTEFVDAGCSDLRLYEKHPNYNEPFAIQWNAPDGGAKKVASYTLTSGTDPLFDPRDFRLLGAEAPGGPWTVLDTQQNVTFGGRQEKKDFVVKEPRAFPVVRLESAANTSGTMGMRLAEFEFLDEQGRNVVKDSACLITGRYEKWGPFLSLDQKLVKPEALPVPATVRLPGTPRNLKRKVFEVRKGTGNDAQELQAQIDAAAKELQAQIDAAAKVPNGVKPSVVVHLPKGIFQLDRTVTVPAPRPAVVKRKKAAITGSLQIVGDGVGNGSSLAYTGGTGPVLRLTGPSRAVLRDIEMSAAGQNGADVILIENADQENGRIYTEQLNAGGSGERRCAVAVFVDGMEKGDVTMICGGFSGCLSGVKVRGGQTLSAGGKVTNQVVFLCGASSSGCRLMDVVDGGQLVAESFWYEGDFDYPAALLDLSAASSGRLAIAGACWHMTTVKQPLDKRQPIISVNGFKGLCTILGSYLYKMEVPCVRLTGDGSQSSIACFGSTFDIGGNVAWPMKDAWSDQTEPPAQVAVFGANGASIMNRQFGAMPDPASVRRALEQIRAVRIAPARDQPAEATDVKLFRINLCAGEGREGVHIQAAKPDDRGAAKP